MTINYTTKGTCSRQINIEVEDGIIKSCEFIGGCNGNLKGILQMRKFLKAYMKLNHNVILASVMDYPYFVSADDPIDEVLTELSNHRRNLAIVKNSEGNIVGILTVEDILEELVGEIYDEDDIGGADDE